MNKKRFLLLALSLLVTVLLLFTACENNGGTDTTSAKDISSAEVTSSVEPTSGDETTAEPGTSEESSAATEVTTSEITTEVITTEEITTEAVTEPVTTAHVHSFSAWETTKSATCLVQGEQKRSCSCGEFETQVIGLAAHTVVTDKKVDATCTTAGKTEGSHCSVCNTVIKEQTAIPLAAHTVVTDKKVDATCTTAGKTEGSHCSVCKTVIKAQTEIKALNHDYSATTGICSRCKQLNPSFNTLIYYESFESQSLSDTSDTVLKNLGWTKDTTANGAYKNNTASYSIVSKNGSKQLYIKNNITDGTDSYIFVLNAAQFGIFHESNYTYQYDITYDDASAGDRYIALVSDYNGDTYNSFHFRNRGTANNQAHKGGSWVTYDSSSSYKADATGTGSICTKLLGKTYNSSTQVFKGISVSVRYVVDWQNGNKVYMRVNTAGYPETGKWTLISTGSTVSPFKPSETGGAIVLKTGGKQNGWIDNIIIWAGTGEQPDLGNQVKVTSKTATCSGHNYAGEGNCLNPVKCIYCGQLRSALVHNYAAVSGTTDKQCSVCGTLESNAGTSWLLPQVPKYVGGTPASALYLAGQGLSNSSLPKANENEMLIIRSTTSAQFDTYCQKLATYGYTKTFSNAYDSNKFAEYYNGKTRIYTYFTNTSKETRIIIDRNSTASPTDFGYTASGTGTVVYQYGLPYSVKGTGISSNGENKIDCGMLYVIKLCDNKVVIIDGGGYQQFDTAEIDGLMTFLRTVTGVPSGQKIQIAGWYFTHCHSDHMAGFALFIKKYSSQLTLERVICNFPSAYSTNSTLAGQKGNQGKLATYIKTYFGSNVPFLQIHTGEYIQLANVTINCIYTHEDLVTASTGVTGIGSDFNNSSIVSRFDFEGIRFMLLGDINKPAQTKIVAMNSDTTLKSDVVQMGHHVINDLSTLYNKIKATAVFVPQSPGGATRGSRSTWLNIAKSYVENDMFYYASEGTYGIKAENGKPALAYSRAGVDGGAWTDWSW